MRVWDVEGLKVEWMKTRKMTRKSRRRTKRKRRRRTKRKRRKRRRKKRKMQRRRWTTLGIGGHRGSNEAEIQRR